MPVDFNALLSKKMRWPTKGDAPFRKTGTQQDAYFWTRGEQRKYAMAESYKLAADILVDQAVCLSHGDRDYLAYPILFSYRHYIELSLKMMIASYGSPIWDRHELDVLWKKLEEIFVEYGVEDPDGATKAAKRIVLEFAKIDPKSFSNRYPVDTKGEEIAHSMEALDLANLKDVMEGLGRYFGGTDSYLEHLKESAAY
jgi:hypothetical protein